MLVFATLAGCGSKQSAPAQNDAAGQTYSGKVMLYSSMKCSFLTQAGINDI